MKIIEELKAEGFEEVNDTDTAITLMRNNCVVIISDFALVKIQGEEFLFKNKPDFPELINFLKEKNN